MTKKQEQQQHTVKVVLFDMGGVVTAYQDLNNYTRLIDIVEKNPKVKERFVQFERGEITVFDVKEEFWHLFGLKHKNDLENFAVKNQGKPNPYVERAIQSLRVLGKYKLALLSNTGFWNAERTKTTMFSNEHQHFDWVIESCRIGNRKPDPQFYETALKTIGLQPEECVFIDDLEMNCLGAEAVGIKSIWLKDGDDQSAMVELEKILGETLL